MITKPTVFILGAGASYSFGYPLGKNLVEIILKNFDPDSSENTIELFKGLGFSEDDILSFWNQLRLSAAPASTDINISVLYGTLLLIEDLSAKTVALKNFNLSIC